MVSSSSGANLTGFQQNWAEGNKTVEFPADLRLGMYLSMQVAQVKLSSWRATENG